MNLLQKAERAIRSVQLVFWGAVAGLILGTILGTIATRYWYTTLARPGPAGDSQTPRVVISPRATLGTTPGPGEEAAKSVTKSQGIQITVKGHVKGPAKRVEIATRPQEVPISAGEGKSSWPDQIGGPAPRIPGPEEAKIAPSSTVGGTVGEAVPKDVPPGGGQVSRAVEAVEAVEATETTETAETAEITEIAETTETAEMTTAAPATPAAPETMPPPVAFHVGDRAEGTVTGELEIVDAVGRPITTEPLTVSGEYTLEFPEPGRAELDLRFTVPAVMAVEFPRLTRPADPFRSIRLAASAGWFVDRPFLAITAGYARRWPIIGGLSAWAGSEAGWAWTLDKTGPVGRVTAGIEYKF